MDSVSFRWHSKIRAAGFSFCPVQDRHCLRLSETFSVNQIPPPSSHPVPLSSAPRRKNGLACTVQTAGLTHPLTVVLSTEGRRGDCSKTTRRENGMLKIMGEFLLKQK